MKKTLYIIALLISFTSIVKAQLTYREARSICTDRGFYIGQEWQCSLQQSEYFTKTFIFQAGVTYDIVALSEDRNVSDVDIQIFNADGDVYAQDTKTDPYAIVSFTPSYTQTLTIKVKNYSSYTPSYASEVAFFVAYKD